MKVITIIILIIYFSIEFGLFLYGKYTISSSIIKRFLIYEESYKKSSMVNNNNEIIENIETRFYPKRMNTLFFIPIYSVGLDLMTTLNYSQNFCLTLEEAQESIKKYIIFKKTKGIKVHKYKEPKEKKKESMNLIKGQFSDSSKCAELILPKRDKK